MSEAVRAEHVDKSGPARMLRPAVPIRLAAAFAPLSNAGLFYAGAWRKYAGRREDDIPVVRPTVALAGNVFLDEMVLTGFRMLRPPGKGPEVGRVEGETRAALELYEESGWCDDPRTFFAPPPPLSAVKTRTVTGRRLIYERVSFESGYEPFPGEPGRDRWMGYAANGRARAWMLRHEEPRPWLLVVHGAMMGRPEFDLALLRARWLHQDLGLNVVLPVLPLHGPRRRDLPRSAMFPSEDLIDNIHGASQGVWDIRRLVTWIRSQDPDTTIGITGISLGGYMTAMVASLQDGLTCAIPGVPAVDLVDLIAHHAGLPATEERRRTLTLAERAGRVISPLALTPLVSPEGRFIYAGLADRLVHPRRQVVRLWEHWGRPQIKWYEGGHTGFSRSKSVGRFVQEALTQAGLVTPNEAAATRL